MRVLYNERIWGKDDIQQLLDSNDRAVSRALMVVYANQTADEQASEQTKHDNGIGFTGRDAEWLTDIAKKWQRYGRWASQKQLNAVRRAMKKYWRQMLLEMVEKGAVEVKGRVKIEELIEQQESDEARFDHETERRVEASFEYDPEVQRELEMEGSW